MIGWADRVVIGGVERGLKGVVIGVAIGWVDKVLLGWVDGVC